MSTYAEIISKCKKNWACPELMDSVNTISGKKIPFSSPSLNWATYGGVPRGALTVFYGTPSGGKSTTAIDICKNAKQLFEQEYFDKIAELTQKVAKGNKECKAQLADLQDSGPKRVLYLDIEHTFDKQWAAKMGVIISEEDSDIDVMQTPNVAAEAILQSVIDIIATNEVGLIVLDSVPSLVPSTELDKDVGERTVAALANVTTSFVRKVNQLLKPYDCTMIAINQLRANMANPYADNTPGGMALKFYASLILSFNLGSPVDFLGGELPMKAENPAGYLIDVAIKKQKSAPFDRKRGSYYLMTQSGIRIDFEYADLAIKRYNIIVKNKGWYTICDPETKEPLEAGDSIVKVNGLVKVYDYLQANPDYYEKLRNYIEVDINNTEPAAVSEDSDGEQ